MRAETLNQILDSLKELSSHLGSKDYSTIGMAILRLTFPSDTGPPPELSGPMMEVVGSVMGDPRLAKTLHQKYGLATVDPDTLKHELNALTDAQGDQLRAIVLRSTQELAPMISRFMKSYAERLPSSPSGRPTRLSPHDARQVCERILALQREGVDLSDAKKRMQDHYSVSAATVNRVWRDRASLLSQSSGEYQPTSEPSGITTEPDSAE